MDFDALRNELDFKAVRSGGPGGQHANKTATKVEVYFDIETSQAITDKERQLLRKRLKNQINSEGVLILSCSETRSQHRNKELVVLRLWELLKENLKVRKPRKKSKPSKSAIEKRLQAKKRQAMKKGNRKPPKIE